MTKGKWVFTGLALLSLLMGCQKPGPRFNPYHTKPATMTEMQSVPLTNRIPAEWLASPTNFYTLGPGDRLEIELVGDPTSKTLTTVGPDGKVYFHLLPGLDVWGKTLSETKNLVEKELGNFIRDQTQVSIILRAVESKRIWVLGRVQQPGVYPLQKPMTLLEGLSMAGGTLSISGLAQNNAIAFTGEEVADLRRSFVMRQGKVLPVDFEKLLKHGDLTQNIFLQPDDFVYIPAAAMREIYVLGAVAQPKAVPYRDGLTLVGAIADALGTVKYAYDHHVAVVRGSLSDPKIAVMDYKDIVRGKTPDVLLEPQDIVYVPYSPYRYLQNYADIALQTFVSSVAINEGARAGAKTAQGGAAGIFIPVGSGISINTPGARPTVR